MKVANFASSILIGSVLLASCVQQPRTIDSPANSPFPTNTLPARPTRSSTPAPTATATVDPTGLAEETANEIEYQARIASFDATQDAVSTLDAQFPSHCSQTSSTLYSPDGKWLAGDCLDRFIVINRDGSKQWQITHQEARDGGDQPLQGVDLDVSSMGAYHWSADDQQVYFFMDYCCFDGIPDYGTFEMPLFARPLYRLDTQTGNWSKFATAANEFSFSPTERRLVSIHRTGWGPERENHSIEIIVVDLRTGEQTTHILDHTLAAGYVVWSGDGTKFFFSSVHARLDESTYRFDFSVYMADVSTRSLIELQTIKDSEATIYPIELTEENVLVVQLLSYGSNSQWITEDRYLDLTTNQFILATSTPTP
jgi:hypothetical protein